MLNVSSAATERSSLLLFWLGSAAVAAGALAHLPMFIASAEMNYMMAGMPEHDPLMMAGMALIVVGVSMACYGLLPAKRSPHASTSEDVVVESSVEKLNPAHWLLVGAIVTGLAVDTMKPATLGFILPGMAREYGLSQAMVALFPLCALTGTVIGSIAWGYIADIYGRRASILLGAVMFVGTSICGFMPTFGWNLFMCFLMGMAAGGMLPVCYALLSEAIPRRHRGWIMVLCGGLGMLGGFFLASGLSSLLQPIFGWRILWFAGLPTGVLLLFLERFIPESPKFLVHHGRTAEAVTIMRRFGAVVVGRVAAKVRRPDAGFALLLSRTYAATTVALCIAGFGWGLLNFGLILWLPAKLAQQGHDVAVTSAILAQSAFLALPTIVAIAIAYHWWSTKWSVATSLAVGLAGLLGILQIESGFLPGLDSPLPFLLLLIVGTNAVIATLLPYAAENYPVDVRGRATGTIAAATKLGGLGAQFIALAGLDPSLTTISATLMVPIGVAVVLIACFGLETRDSAPDEELFAGVPSGAVARSSFQAD